VHGRTALVLDGSHVLPAAADQRAGEGVIHLDSLRDLRPGLVFYERVHLLEKPADHPLLAAAEARERAAANDPQSMLMQMAEMTADVPKPKAEATHRRKGVPLKSIQRKAQKIRYRDVLTPEWFDLGDVLRWLAKQVGVEEGGRCGH